MDQSPAKRKELTGDDLMAQLNEARKQGKSLSPEDLCRNCPEFLDDLKGRIQAMKSMEKFQDGKEAGLLTTPFEQVVSVCEDFRGDDRAGSHPSIKSYLDRVGEDTQPTLLRNLLAIDIENRRAAGEYPQLEDYLEPFPQFAPLIRDVFLGLSSLSSVISHETAKPKVAADKVLSVSRLGDYRLLGQLGRGGMGVVYEALHQKRGNHVALKTLPAVDGAALHRFKREFRALADVNHPNLIGLHTLEADGAQWFFTMDLVEGTDFLSYVRPNGILDKARLRSALVQLVTGVMALHGRHIIHRDLKHSNVMVTHDGHVIVLDFGLVAEQNRAGISQSTEKVAGTPTYMAPEQAAGNPVVPASDWYAVGVMLYEALCGKPPFSGSLLRVLQDKQKLDAPALPCIADLPEDLAALCMRLLSRNPRQRPDAFEITKVISAHATATPAAAAYSSHHLIGRELQLAALNDALRTLQRRREPLTVFISGRSGEGKTTLAEHFLAPLRRDQQLSVMSGRCYDRESVPFKALDTLIDALSSFLRSLSVEEAALLMPDDIGALALVFPVLQRVEVVARASDPRLSTLDEQQVRGRAFRALRSLLSRVSRRSLILWFIDDLQWGDADSAEALFEVLRPPEAPAVLFLGAFRSDETEGSPFLKMWKELQRKHGVQFADSEIKVSPLTVEECTELVIDLLGKDNAVVRRRAAEFAQESRGNPYLLIELIGCFDPDTDSFEPVPLHEALAKKLGQLPAEAGPLLEVVAVSGQPLSLEEASRTAGHDLPPIATITRMRNERLLRLIGPENSPLVDTYHDRVRETILGQLDEKRCKALHLTLAEIIAKDVGYLSAELVAMLEGGERTGEEKVNPRVYDLAYHYDAAGEKRKAWVYALKAAEQAHRQSALEVATQQYAMAKRNAEGTTNALRYRIAEGYGEALMLLGRYEEADQELASVLDLISDAEKKARIEVLQGENAFKQGAMKLSNNHYEGGLLRLGNSVPRSVFGFGCGILREIVIQCVHSLLPWRMHQTSLTSNCDLSVRLFNRLSITYVFQNSFKMLWANLSGLNRAELLPPSQGLAFSYALHACWMSMLGWPSRASRYGNRALVLARDFDDQWGKGNCCTGYGIGLYASARYKESLALLAEAIKAFEKAGDLWECHLAHFHQGCCHFGLGNLGEAIAEARRTFASSARIGDSRTLCSSWLWARATLGNFPFEELKSCYPCRPDDIMSTVHGVLAEGYWHTFHGRTAEALVAFERAAAMVRKTLCVNSHMILVVPMLAMGLRLHADAVQPKDAKQSELLRKRAYRVAKWATRLTWLFPAAYPLALRERALILAAFGKTKQALKFADRSCNIAVAQKANYEHAQSLLVRGRLAKKLGLAEADQQIRTAEAAIEAIERPVREAATGQAVTSTPAPQAEPKKPDEATMLAGHRSLVWPIMATLLTLVGAVLAGHLLGWCTGYAVGFVSGVIGGNLQTGTETGVGVGAAIGRVAFPLLMLAGWVLIQWGKRHYETTAPWRGGGKPTPPSPLVRYGLIALVGGLLLNLWMIPVTLGLGLGSVFASAFAGSGPWATALPALGGVVGLVLPFILWRRTR